MSTEMKVRLASQARDDFGLPTVLAALGLPRSTWYYHQRQAEGQLYGQAP